MEDCEGYYGGSIRQKHRNLYTIVEYINIVVVVGSASIQVYDTIDFDIWALKEWKVGCKRSFRRPGICWYGCLWESRYEQV